MTLGIQTRAFGSGCYAHEIFAEGAYLWIGSTWNSPNGEPIICSRSLTTMSHQKTRPPTEAASDALPTIEIPISTAAIALAATYRSSFSYNFTPAVFPRRDFRPASPSVSPVAIDSDPSRTNLKPLGLSRAGSREQRGSPENGCSGSSSEHCFHHVAFLRINNPGTSMEAI
jgi:hypothetical protein